MEMFVLVFKLLEIIGSVSSIICYAGVLSEPFYSGQPLQENPEIGDVTYKGFLPSTLLETGLVKNPLEDYTYNGSNAHGLVVGNVLRVTLFMILTDSGQAPIVRYHRRC